MVDASNPLTSAVSIVSEQGPWAAACVILGFGILGQYLLNRRDSLQKEKKLETLYDRYLADIKLAGEQVARSIETIKEFGRLPKNPRTGG